MNNRAIPTNALLELIETYESATQDGDDVDVDVMLRDLRTLIQDAQPHTILTEEEYAALPQGSIIGEPDLFAFQKNNSGLWSEMFTDERFTNAEISGTARTVLRYGWTGEQPQPKPAWRIEHEYRNLRVGEYIIDCENYEGTVIGTDPRGHWKTDTDGAYGAPEYAPFIVFLNRDAATLEAIEEAKKARDKEVGE